VLPIHTEDTPPIADNGNTVTTVVATQPESKEYEITEVPAPKPVTNPVLPITVAIAVLLLLHTPPDIGLESGVEKPTQVDVVPVDGANGCTVTTRVTLQP
jgi:hypothetical protein